MNLCTLPTGTKFYVENGNWNGQILEENGEKYLLVIESNRKHKLSPTEDHGLDIRTEEGILEWEIEANTRYNQTEFLYHANEHCRMTSNPKSPGASNA